MVQAKYNANANFTLKTEKLTKCDVIINMISATLNNTIIKC